MELEHHILSNGLRLVHQHSTSKIGHLGIIVNAGTRDEHEHEHGLAHFIEHGLFKGTQRRKAYHVLSLLEDVGGDLNAYTNKEETCVYASFLCEYFPRAFDLLSDIVFHSTFPEKELEKEREVVADEINSYKDSPAEQIFDDFDEQVYSNDPIGRNILGTSESLQTFDTQRIQEFIRREYTTDQIVVSSVGNIAFDKVVRLFEKFLGDVPASQGSNNRKPFVGYQKTSKIVEMETYQAHCIMGNLAYPLHHESRTALALLNNVLGGVGMNSRLNLSLREKYGYAYSVESSFSSYTDTGLLSIYFGTDRHNLDKSIKLVQRELDRLCQEPLGIRQLQKAKCQIIGQLAMSNENNEGQMISQGKSLLHLGYIKPLDEIIDELNALSAAQLQRVAQDVLDKEKMSMLVFR